MTSGLVTSISYSQDEILGDIMVLHNGGLPFECDVTYGHGGFYRGVIPRPRLVTDLAPGGDVLADAAALPLRDESVCSIVFDPPFLHTSGAGSMIKERFGDFKSIPKLWSFYERSMREFRRVLCPDGILVFKCGDTVSCGQNWFSHVHVCNLAEIYGLLPLDLFILLAKHRLPQWNIRKQQHARKHHSFFWVFGKR